MERVDLVITDVVMPQMDGPAMVHELRAIDPMAKVIFISGYAEDAFRQRLDSERDIHFLAKPFNLKQLALKVKEVMPARLRSRKFRLLQRTKRVHDASASRCTAAPAVK
jgi:two-component system cell cycle sensor histidine kinase/response regulator CckA